jgi:hypothetical protein
MILTSSAVERSLGKRKFGFGLDCARPDITIPNKKTPQSGRFQILVGFHPSKYLN